MSRSTLVSHVPSHPDVPACESLLCSLVIASNGSGQLIATSTEVTPNGGLGRESYPKWPYSNSSAGLIVVWLDG